jgi:hypothetical protein
MVGASIHVRTVIAAQIAVWGFSLRVVCNRTSRRQLSRGHPRDSIAPGLVCDIVSMPGERFPRDLDCRHSCFPGCWSGWTHDNIDERTLEIGYLKRLTVGSLHCYDTEAT